MVLQRALHPLDGSYTLAGERRPAMYGQTLEVRSPIDGAAVGAVHEYTAEEVDALLARCAADQPAWGALPADERAAVLRRFADLLEEHGDDIAELLVLEIAKARREARDEVERGAELVRLTADAGRVAGEGAVGRRDAGGLTFSHRVPLGTVVAIVPFTFPIHLGLARLAPALAAGNAVVLKPPMQGALASTVAGELLLRAGVPPGVAHVVTGRGAVVGDQLVRHGGVDLVAFTGSHAVGREIAYRVGLVPMALELGGGGACIVLGDADLDAAAEAIVAGAFAHSGQRPTAFRRVLAVEPVADELVGLLAGRAGRLGVGDPRHDRPITALVDPAGADRAAALVDQAVGMGAVLMCGGGRNGNLVEPVVVDRVDERMELAWVDPLAPVLPVLRMPHAAAAVELANRGPLASQAVVFGRDVEAATQVALRLEAGTVQINGRAARGPVHPRFTGTRAVGAGGEGAGSAIEAMTRLRSIVVATGDVDLTALR